MVFYLDKTFPFAEILAGILDADIEIITKIYNGRKLNVEKPKICPKRAL